jgi:glycosyltransferase involved in cell wall biosynthesis
MHANKNLQTSKKVAIVVNVAWGIYNFRMHLIQSLIEKGFQVIVIAPADGYEKLIREKVNIKYIPTRHFTRSSLSIVHNLRMLFEMLSTYRKEKPDLIIHFTVKANIFGSLAAAWNNIPSISVVTGLGFTFLDGKILRRLVKLLYRFSFRWPVKTVFENPDDLRLFEHSGIIKPGQGCVVNGCGVDAEYFSPAPDVATQAESKGEVVFAFIGRLLYDKGIQEFVDAARAVKVKEKNTRFWLVGDPDPENPSSVNRETLQSWIAGGLVEHFKFTNDVRPFIAASHCIVMPSYREGLPKILLEAMSMAKPIITTDVPGCRETIRNSKNGLLVPVKSSEGLVQAMSELIKMSPEAISDMGNSGRNLVLEKFTEEKVAQQYINILKEIPELLPLKTTSSHPEPVHYLAESVVFSPDEC